MFNIFKIKTTDLDIIKKLGTIIYIRNGVGYGFISDEELYHNQRLEIGFGRSFSGHGDWGGGFDRAACSPLKIVVDRDLNIISAKTESFYNSKPSQVTEVIAKKLMKRLPGKLIIKNATLAEIVKQLFSVIPAKHHIGLDANLNDPIHSLNMTYYFTTEVKSSYIIEDCKTA